MIINNIPCFGLTMIHGGNQRFMFTSVKK